MFHLIAIDGNLIFTLNENEKISIPIRDIKRIRINFANLYVNIFFQNFINTIQLDNEDELKKIVTYIDECIDNI